jgi:hypothetical protein
VPPEELDELPELPEVPEVPDPVDPVDPVDPDDAEGEVLVVELPVVACATAAAPATIPPERASAPSACLIRNVMCFTSFCCLGCLGSSIRQDT